MSDDIKKVLPTKLPTAMDHEMNLPKSEVHHYDVGGEVDQPVADLDDKQKHISEKVYYMPESYNALRIEMYEHWQDTVWPAASWFMAFDAVQFVEVMDLILDTKTTFDTAKVDGICKKYLDLLRIKRGVSPLHGTLHLQRDVKIILPPGA